MKKNKIIYGLYDDDKILINAIIFLKKKKIYINEVYTPFPIHEVINLLKIKETKISKNAFLFGLIGFIFSSILTWYTMDYDWPQNIGGKSSKWIINFPSFIPVIFELTIFFSAHFMCIKYLFDCNLYPFSKKKIPDKRITDNMFVIEILLNDNNENQIIYLLKKSLVKEIKIVK